MSKKSFFLKICLSLKQKRTKMEWLILISKQANISQLQRKLARVGARLVGNQPVSTEVNGFLYQALGPQDLPSKVKGFNAIKEIHLDSEMVYS